MVLLPTTGVVLASSAEPVGAASKTLARAGVWVNVGATSASERSHDVVALDAIHRRHDTRQHCGVTSELSGGLCFIEASLV